MYPISTKYLEAVQSTSRHWDLYIDVVLADNTSLTLNKESIDLGTFQVKAGSTCSNTIQIGSTYSNSVEFRILNREGQFDEVEFSGAKLRPYVGLAVGDPDEYEYVPLGVFNILEPVKKFSTISIIGFDNMSLMNKVFDFSQLVFPTTPIVIFDEVIRQCDIECTETMRASVERLTYTVNSLLTNDPMCRDIVAGLGIMLLQNIRFNHSGVLESFWYEDVLRSTTKYTRVGNSSYGDTQVLVTGVYLEDAYGNSFSFGTDEYPVELPTSPIIQGSTMVEPILEAALERLQSVQHRSANITWIGDPAIQAGDVIRHEDTAVGDIVLPVMRLVYKFAGTETIESLGLSGTTLNQQSSTTKKLRKAFSRAEAIKLELESKISQTAEDVLLQVSKQYTGQSETASLIVRVDGIASEVSQQSETIEGLQSSVVAVTQSTSDLSITVQHITEVGTDKVTTKEAKYTFNDEGLSIAKAGEEMANKLDNTGMYVTRSGETILQANNAGVVATDVKVRNYLVVGEHARFEDYSDGSDTRRTACFYVT